ncbi:MAG TPA: DNA gyrase C-terminal beta-propeller domain-containing protein, partial [Anaerolineaceae bacterium]|nr:DNA gyrase C-terminal beta-propeller domain-containing protein [Anaerolineaceae bacterium]
GDADLLLVSRQGMAIRFNEKIVPPQGGQGMRMADGDELIAITAVYDDSGVFLAGADGKGTIRLMSAFAPNKSMGGSGKIAIRNDHVVGATAVAPADDLFLISQLGKIIRFRADEVPSTEGAIQGVNCMGVRFDEVVAVIKSSPKTV